MCGGFEDVDKPFRNNNRKKSSQGFSEGALYESPSRLTPITITTITITASPPHHSRITPASPPSPPSSPSQPLLHTLSDSYWQWPTKLSGRGYLLNQGWGFVMRTLWLVLDSWRVASSSVFRYDQNQFLDLNGWFRGMSFAISSESPWNLIAFVKWSGEEVFRE